MSVGALLTQMRLGNTYAHTGAISFMKGSWGRRGFPVLARVHPASRDHHRQALHQLPEHRV